MSIQQNVNQLLTMAGTAAMLNPQLRQKTEDNTKLRKLDKEEASLVKIANSDSVAARSPEASKQRHRLNELRFMQKEGKLTDTDKAELDVLEQQKVDAQNTTNERMSRLLEIAYERAGIDPSEENIRNARNLRDNESMRHVLQERSKQRRKEALERMRQEGQNKLEQKTEFDKFKESLSSDDNFHSLSPAAQKIAYEQYTKGGK